MQQIFQGLDALAGGRSEGKRPFGTINNYGVIFGWGKDEDGNIFVTVETALPVQVIKPQAK